MDGWMDGWMVDGWMDGWLVTVYARGDVMHDGTAFGQVEAKTNDKWSNTWDVLDSMLPPGLIFRFAEYFKVRRCTAHNPEGA